MRTDGGGREVLAGFVTAQQLARSDLVALQLDVPFAQCLGAAVIVLLAACSGEIGEAGQGTGNNGSGNNGPAQDAGHDGANNSPDAERPDLGPPEEPTPIDLDSLAPRTEVTALGEPAINFVVDTGSPVTILDIDYYGGGGRALDIDFSAFGQDFRGVPAVAYNIYGSPPPGAEVIVGGIIGSDFLGDYALVIDYRNSWGYLLQDLVGRPNVAAETTRGVEVPMDILGGGGFGIPDGGGNVNVGETRLVVTGTIEGREVGMMIDTGASLNIIEQSLANGGGRPRLGGVSIQQVGGVRNGTVTRLSSIEVGGVEIVGETAMYIEGNGTFDSLSNETGTSIRVLLGGTFFRHFLATFNYPEMVMRLDELANKDHINSREWIGPGFKVIDAPAGDYGVSDVYDGTPAAAAGVQPGDRIMMVDGQPTTDFELNEFRQHLASYEPGQMVDFTFRNGGDATTITLRIDDLLPQWP